MKLAVLMAVHNNALTLKSAVNSILTQTYKDFEFIIINDASTDDSLSILKNFKDKRIKIITNRHQLGLTKSLNKGLAQIKTKYIARMDADDISLPTRLEKQVSYLDTHSQIGLLGSAAFLINDQGKELGLKRFPSDYLHLRRQALSFCPFIHPTWMIRRSVLLQIGDYNESFPFAQDYELVLRLLNQFQAANLEEPLIKYRVNSDSAISLGNLKKQELLALKARFLALKNYHYSLFEAWKLVKPLLSFLIPVGIKKIIYRKFYWV